MEFFSSAHRTKKTHKAISVAHSSSAHIGGRTAISMSCYAYFQDWLLPSLSIESYGRTTPDSTECALGNLNRLSGLFPSRLRAFAPWA